MNMQNLSNTSHKKCSFKYSKLGNMAIRHQLIKEFFGLSNKEFFETESGGGADLGCT
jgi:hypothetical protein